MDHFKKKKGATGGGERKAIPMIYPVPLLQYYTTTT